MAHSDAGTQPFSKQDPLQHVKAEIESGSPRLNPVGNDEKLPEETQKQDVVKGDVSSVLADAYKEVEISGDSGKDDGTSNAAAANEALESDQNAVRGLEDGSGKDTLATNDITPERIRDMSKVHFRISANPRMRAGGPRLGDLKSEERKAGVGGDETIVSDDTVSSKDSSPGNNADEPITNSRLNFRVSANPKRQPGVSLHGDLISEGGNAGVESDNPVTSDDTALEPSSGGSADVPITTNQFLPKVPVRGTPTFRISAHHGMRPGGPLSRDLPSETSEGGDFEKSSGGERSGSRGQAVSSRGGLNNFEPMRGGGRGLARTSSEVSGEKTSGAPLAKSGSGMPGFSLARTGSGIGGNAPSKHSAGTRNSLARTGSGVPSVKDTNPLNDLSALLDSKT